ncbi:MAG: carbohydrate ABC transporter substrate-binding protein [Oscillospiraceae bacterium]|jgi:N-acetylglucosamine transport system substrate-binding protein
MKKVICILMTAVLCFSVLLSGCGQVSPFSAEGGEASSENKLEGELKINVAQGSYAKNMWQQLANAFVKENPGVKVTVTVDPEIEALTGQMKEAGDCPDLMVVPLGRAQGMTETELENNAMLDLSDVLEEVIPGEAKTVKDKMLPGINNEAFSKNGKQLLLPEFFSPAGLVYDQHLFQQNGWQVPKTWDEMWTLADQAKAKGISLFAYSKPEDLETFFYGMLANTDSTLLSNVCSYQEGVWNSDQGKKVLDTFAKLASYTDGAVPANANDENYLKNEQLLLEDKALFMPGESGILDQTAQETKAEGFEWGFAPVPSFESGKDQTLYTVTSECWIPAASEDQELGKKFLVWSYSDEAAAICAQFGETTVVSKSETQLDQAHQAFYSQYGDQLTNGLITDEFLPAGASDMKDFRSSLFGTFGALVSGEVTPESWSQGVITATDTLRTKRNAST